MTVARLIHTARTIAAYALDDAAWALHLTAKKVRPR